MIDVRPFVDVGRVQREGHNTRMDHGPASTEPATEGIIFAPWRTPVENDELSFVSLHYGGVSTRCDYPQDGFSLELPAIGPVEIGDLEAVFLSREKRSAIIFRFSNPNAFRVLDEHGLVDIWAASQETPRPARSTFMVKGHKWQAESELSWFLAGAEFSLMIATDWDCLEVVGAEPTIEIRPAIVHEHASR